MKADVIVKQNPKLGEGYVLATPVSERAKDYMRTMFAKSTYDVGAYPFMSKTFGEPFNDFNGNELIIERQDVLPADT